MSDETSMPDAWSELMNRFADGAMAEREKLAKRLIDAGYSPDTVAIGERYWYDEKEYTLRYECFPLVNPPPTNPTQPDAEVG